MRKLFLVLILMGIVVSLGLASNENSGNVGAQFLKINPGARAVGMGNVYVSLGESSDAMYYNPALLTGIGRMDFSVMNAVWFRGSYYFGAFGAVNFKKFGTVGASISGLVYRGLNSTINSGNGRIVSSDSKARAGDFCITAAYGYKFDKYFGIGVNLKAITQKLDTESAAAFATDLGIIARPADNKWGVGLSVQNLGTKIKFVEEKYKLPFNVRVGGHYSVKLKVRHKILFGTEIQKPIDDLIVWNIGSEYSFNKLFALRLGYQVGGDASGIKFGAGFQYKIMQIDYGFNYFGNMGTTHLMQVSIRINKNDSGQQESSTGNANDEVEEIETEEGLMKKANVFMKNRDYDNALEEYKKVVKINNSNIEALYNLACIYSIKNNTGESLSAIILLLSKSPDLANRVNQDTDLLNVRNTESYKAYIKQFISE